MKVLITGATGFLGSAVLRLLVNEGYNVRVLVRENANMRNLEKFDIEVIRGDLQNTDSLKPAVHSCDQLFHVAADYRLWVPNPEQMYKTNIDGTRNLIMAATNAGVEKIVYTSSVATLGINEDGTPADEITPSSLEDMIGTYKRSKFLAEQTVKGLITKKSCPVTIVNPSTPVGPYDIKPTPTGKIILDTIRNRMPAYVETGLNIVHVDDVAQGHLLAMEKGEIGERYILGGDDMSLESIISYLCNSENINPPKIKLPHNFILPIAWIMECIAKFTGNEPLATIDGVRMSKKMMYFSSKKARRKLGYYSRPATEGLKDALEWFNKEKYQ
ncbi:MAG: hopanoid-associated sugar epimerase [Pseudomonadota bacterium]|nr:hopanoid-associated sugar epimerase [Pseudomonadota bacterium]|tara:strand:- start:5150 stop:6136 length:987 start_codon:yes stop_codon:yes gene_type:complete